METASNKLVTNNNDEALMFGLTNPRLIGSERTLKFTLYKVIPTTLVRVITHSGSPREKNLNFGLVWSSRDPSWLFLSSHFWRLFAICHVPILTPTCTSTTTHPLATFEYPHQTASNCAQILWICSSRYYYNDCVLFFNEMLWRERDRENSLCHAGRWMPGWRFNY